MFNIKIWPDGSWIHEDNWETLPEDYSDDYLVVSIPNYIEDVDSYILFIDNIA